MFARIFGFRGGRAPRPAVVWAFCLVLGLLPGCKKSETPAEPKAAGTNAAAPAKAGTPNVSQAIARLHWSGKKKLAADPNSAYLMTIWNLPESAKLEAQTLNKLAIAPWLATLSNPPSSGSAGSASPPAITNYDEIVAAHPAASLLRPLLEDLLQEEWQMEVKSPRAQSGGTDSPTGTPPAENRGHLPSSGDSVTG